MGKTRTISRWALARRLQDLALRISAGKPVRIGGVSVRVPEQVVLEEELETTDGEVELELELKWPQAAPSPARSPARKPRRAARK